MTVSIQPLAETLQGLIELHQALLELAKEKTPVLVDNRVDVLTQLMNKESKLLKKVVELDQLRTQAMNEYLTARGYHPNPNVTISDLAKMIFKMDEKKILLQLQEEFTALLTKLKHVNELNQKLIEQSLMFINYSVDLLLDSPPEVTYGKPQQHAPSASRAGLFDTKA